jgi:hypothetical protein
MTHRASKSVGRAMHRDSSRIDARIIEHRRAATRTSDERAAAEARALYGRWYGYLEDCRRSPETWDSRRPVALMYERDMRRITRPRSRTGQSADEVYIERGRTLDREWNALASAVFEGGGRGMMQTPTELGARMSDAWRDSLRASIEAFRSMRDELNQQWLILGTVWGPRLDESARDLDRYKRDIRESLGEDVLPSTPEPPEPGALEGAARNVGRGLSSVAKAVGVLAGVALAVGVVVVVSDRS